MPRRPYAALAIIPTPYGPVSVRKAWAAKQRTYVAVFDGAPTAISACLPTWTARTATSRRTQVTPPTPITTVPALVTWISSLIPTWTAAAKGGLAPASTAPGLVTLADCRKAAERVLAATVRPATVVAYRVQWDRIARFLPPETPITNLSRERIQGVITDLAGVGYAPTTVRSGVVALHRLLAPAIDASLVQSHLFRRLSLPRPVAKSRPMLTTVQRDDLLRIAAEHGRDAHLLVALGLLAGLRRAEILALTWADIDLERQVLAVHSSAHFTTKSGRNRVVPLCRTLAGILAQHRPASPEPDVFVIAPNKPPRRGLRWAFEKTFVNIADEAGIPQLTPHGLRRAFATLGAQAGISVWKLRVWMGHASVKTTEGYTDAAQSFDPEVERLG